MRFAAFAATATAIAAACALAAPAQAAIFTFTGNNTGGPTFNRPLEDLSGLSAVGDAVHYSTFVFRVSITGTYTVLTTGEFDTFLTLYQNSFAPASPLVNAVIANDDLISPPFTTSGFAVDLNAGTNYFLVTSGFGNADVGAFSTTIGGPGLVNVVPEPAAWGMLALGLGALALRRRAANRPVA